MPHLRITGRQSPRERYYGIIIGSYDPPDVRIFFFTRTCNRGGAQGSPLVGDFMGILFRKVAIRITNQVLSILEAIDASPQPSRVSVPLSLPDSDTR